MKKFIKILLCFLFAGSAIVVSVMSLDYISYNTQAYFGTYKNFLHKPFLYIHISFGIIALSTGWFQFSDKLRTKYPTLIRNSGKLYSLSVLISAIGALFSSFFVEGGLAVKGGFFLLALVWLFTLYKGIEAIKDKNFKERKEWFIRNYALTWAAAMLRNYLLLFLFLLKMPFAEVYPLVTWLSWVLNLLLAEYFFIIKPNSKLYLSMSDDIKKILHIR